MGNHRAERRGPRRRPSETRQDKYAGRRVAGREVPTSDGSHTLLLEPADVGLEVAADAAPAEQPTLAPLDPTDFGLTATVVAVDDEPAATLDRTTPFDADATEQLPLVRAPGRRKAVKHSGSRGPLFRGLPPIPALLGVAVLAVSASGAALTVADTEPAGNGTDRVVQASALSGFSGNASVDVLDRGEIVSRDNSRQAMADAAEQQLVAAAEQQNRQRNAALGELAAQAEKQAARIELNQWVLPVQGYRLTATFGQTGLWSSTHTGLDFAAPSGTSLVAIANGTITETGYDGAYGNKTVLTLEDGTEIWYCHQTSINVTPGDTVRAGEMIGTVGSTGNSTGPHLHLEVRPGAGDPVDPYTALQYHGLTP